MLNFVLKGLLLSFTSNVKGALLGLRKFLATENPLRVMKNAFFHLKSSFCSQDI